jgi:hypothetical protein
MSASNIVRRKEYNQSPSLLVFNDGNFYGRSITVDRTKIALDENDERSVPAGSIICKDTTDSWRFLARTKLKSAVAANNTSILSISNPAFFAPLDVLYAVLPYSTVTVSGYSGTTQGETIGVTINGVTVSVTEEDEDTNNAGVATKLANAINNNRAMHKLVNAVAENAVVYVMGNSIVDFHNIAVVTDTTLTATLAHDNSGKLQTETTAVGTVAAVDRPNNEITLQSNAAIGVPEGMPIGIMVQEMIGLIVLDYNMSEINNFNYAPLTASNGVYAKRMPYLDADIEDELCDIKFMFK